MANTAQLKISSELADKIRAHGVQTYPHECCGALLGRDTEVADRRVYREIHGLHPLVNRRDDSPNNRFSVTSQDRKSRPPARPGSRRVVSFAPGSSGAPQSIRPRSCLAVVQLHYCERGEQDSRRNDFVEARRRSHRIRKRRNWLTAGSFLKALDCVRFLPSKEELRCL